VVCIAESTPSLYQRLVQADCTALAASFNPSTVNVSVFLFNFFGPNTTQELIDLVNSYNANMVISVNVLLYPPVKAVAQLFPHVWFLNTRMETKMNDPVTGNVIFLELYEQIDWFLKGVLAAKFSASISSTNNFVIHVPMIEGLFVMPTNFYYAGLLFANPNAKLTAIVHNTFGRDAALLVALASTLVPDYKVFAHFGSQTYYTSNLTNAGKYEMANTLSVYSPAVDYDVLVNNVTTLAFNIINLVPLWQGIVSDGAAGKDLTGRYDIILGNNVYLSNISSFVPPLISTEVRILAAIYLRIPDGPLSLWCAPFIVQTMKQIFPVPNGCVDPIHIVEGSLLHPKITAYPY